MKLNTLFVLPLLLLLMLPALSNAQDDAGAILQNVDNILNAPKDQSLSIRVVIVDKRGAESMRELSLYQKGSDKRVVKFLSPADQKGIGFLSLPPDNMTVYMPAYGKTRKIGGHVKNTKFAGTDYTYEDMEAKRYVEKYNPRLISSDKETWTLELKPKENVRSDYQKLHMIIRKADNYPLTIEYFDKGGNKVKSLESSKIQKSGKYLMARQTVMTDLKNGTKTKMEITNLQFDSGLGDDLFTERQLIR